MKTIFTNGTVTFGHVGKGKWEFTHVHPVDQFKFTLAQPVKGGKEIAGKVANVVGGAMKRTNGRGLDNLARANITKIVGSAA
jgi:hypothetical protein